MKVLAHLKNKSKAVYFYAGLCVAVLTAALITGYGVAFAAAPTSGIGFQGQLYNGTSTVNASVNATFAFYDASSGGSQQGSTIAKTVTVSNGYFSTTFSPSDLSSVDLNQSLWVEVAIEGNTLTPRSAVNSVPFANKAFGAFSFSSAPSVGPSGSLYYNSTTGLLMVSNGSAWATVATSSGSGSATTTINGASGPAFSFAAGSSGTDFAIATSTGTVTFNIPTASASNRGLLSSADYLRIPSTASSTEWAAAAASTTALTPSYMRALFSNTATGLTYNSSTGATSLTAGYVIPLSASTTEWANFFTTPSSRITAGTNLAWSGNTLNFNGTLAVANGGTGTSTAPTLGQLLMGNGLGGYSLVATSSLGITGGSGSGTVNSGTAGQVAFYDANGTAVSGTSTVFFSSGNVGIGTTTPGTQLSVGGNALFIGNATTTGNAAFGTLNVGGRVFVDSLGQIWNANGMRLTDQFGAVLSNSGQYISDPSGNLHSGDGSILSDTNGNLTVDPSNNTFNASAINHAVAIGTSSSLLAKFVVSGTAYVTGTTTLGTARLLGAFYDGSNSAGTAGMVLQSTGTGTQWVATSTLGISAVGSGSATTTINGASGPAFSFAAGSSGTDFAIATSTGTVTFNIPTASASNRGLLSSADYLRIPSAASSTEWASFFATPSSRITAGTNLAWSGNTLNLNGVVGIANGGTGTSTAPSLGQVLVGNGLGGYSLVATSSLGISGSASPNYLVLGSGYLATATTTDAIRAAYFTATSITATSTFAGAVGIGIANPTAKLEIAGDVKISTTSAYYSGVNMIAFAIDDPFSSTGESTNFFFAGAGTTTNNALYAAQGYQNIGIGYTALSSVTSGHDNIAIGPYAMPSITTGDTNIALGSGSLNGAVTASNITAVGHNSAGHTDAPFAYMTAIGEQALYNNVLGTGSVAVGSQVFANGGTSTQNTAVGSFAGLGTASSDNSNNALFGYSAGWALTSGSNNILLGYKAGDAMTSGSNNIVLGYDIDAPSNTGSNQLTIGNLIFGTGLSSTGTTVSSGSIGIGSTTPTARLAVSGVAGSGDVFSVASSTNASMFIIKSTGSIGIGTTTPAAKLAVTGTSGSALDLFSVASSTNAAAFVVKSNGRVGIGTSTPSQTLSVVGDMRLTGGFYDGSNSAGTTGMVLQSTGTGTQWVATSTLGISGSASPNYLALGSGYLATATTTDAIRAAYFTATSTTATSTFAGAVGIGTTSPTAAFQVQTAAATPFSIVTSSGTSLLSLSSSGNLVINNSITTTNSTITSGSDVVAAANSSLAFSTRSLIKSSADGLLTVSNNAGTDFTRLNFGGVTSSFPAIGRSGTSLFVGLADGTNGGSFGIGTSTPSQALSVVGGMRLTGGFFDGANASGTAGMVLQSTGTSTQWVATSTLGISGGPASSGSSAFTFGNGLIYNATSTDLVGIGTSAPSATLYIQGKGGTNPFVIASSTGVSLLTLTQAGFLGIGTTSPVGTFSVTGTSYFDGSSTFSSSTATTTMAGGLLVGNGSLKYDWSTGVTSIDSVELGALNFATDGGILSWADMDISTAVATNTVESYSAQIDNNPILTIYAEAAGGGAIQNMRVGIGTTTPKATLDVWGNLNVSTSATSTLFVNTATTRVGIGTSTPGQALVVVGNAQFTNVLSGAYAFDLNLTSDGTLTTAASDERLKENIQLISTSTLSGILALKPSTFNWKSDESHRTDVGLIAQDVESIFPELVFTNPNDGFKGVNYSRLSIFLIKGMQEQQVQIEELMKYATFIRTKELHTEKLCVGDETDEVCMDKTQLRQLLNNGNIQPAPAPAPTPDPDPTPDPAPEANAGEGSGSTSGDSAEAPSDSEPAPAPTPAPESNPAPAPAPDPAPAPTDGGEAAAQ